MRLFPKGDWSTQKTAVEKDESARARRLKELAESNKDHDRAKDFHVLEMQAKREHGGAFGYLLNTEFWFEKLGDYGRSTWRPLLFSGVLWIVCAVLYILPRLNIIKAALNVSTISAFFTNLLPALLYSAAQMLPFLSASRSARSKLETALFCDDVPEWVYALNFFQGLIALVLLFLLGLALRHKYRI